MTNEEYQMNGYMQFRQFNYNDTETIYPLKEKLACLPKVFGYSSDQGQKIFPNMTYPPCSSQISGRHTIFSLDIDNNRLTMDCGDTKGKFVIGPPSDLKLTLRREIEDLWQYQEYEGPVNLKSYHDFALGNCDTDAEYMNRAVYVFRPNNTAKQQASEKQHELIQQTGIKKRPLVVQLLVVDSFSRKHFYRKLPETVEYLNQLNKGSDYKVWDFLIHNIIGGNSVANQVPILTSSLIVDDFNPDQDFAHGTGLWSIFKNKGFMTYFGFEDCDDSFPRKLGRMPEVDHTVNQFYCAVYKFTDCRMSKSSQKQRCIGPYMSHHYIMNHTLSFSRAYSGMNQWIYSHLSAAHEATGQHAAALDGDLQEYIQRYLEEFGQDHDVIFFLEADHGMRYGDWYKSSEAFQENRLPAFFIIAPNRVLEDIEYAYDSLEHNAFRLNGKLDIRKTMQFLAGYPYNIQDVVEQNKGAVNLFKEKIPDSRMCGDIGIAHWHCSCLEPIAVDLSQDQGEFQNLLDTLAQLAIEYFNSEIYISSVNLKQSLCQKLSLDAIARAYAINLNSFKQLIKLELKVQESEEFRVEVQFIVSNKMFWGDGVVYPIVNRGFRRYVLIKSYLRLDRFVGTCEIMARESNLNAELCLCKDITMIENYQLKHKIEEKYKIPMLNY